MPIVGEVAGRHDRDVGARPIGARHARRPSMSKADPHFVSLKRQRRAGSRRCTPGIAARRSSSRSLNAICAAVRVLRLAETPTSNVSRRSGAEARVPPHQLQKPGDQQLRADEQHEAERDLSRRRARCEGARGPPRCRALPSLSPPAGLDGGRLERQEPDRTARSSPPPEPPRTRARARRCPSRPGEGCDRRPAAGSPSALPSASRTPPAVAEQSEREALDQQLPHQRASRGAERHPQGELARALGAAGEQQARDVRARDEQHERDRSQQDQDRLLATSRQPRRARAATRSWRGCCCCRDTVAPARPPRTSICARACS